MDHLLYLSEWLHHALQVHDMYSDHIKAMIDNVDLDIKESTIAIESFADNPAKLEEITKRIYAKLDDIRAAQRELNEFGHVIEAGVASLRAQLDNIINELNVEDVPSDQVVPVGCLHLYSDF
uniref:Biogenesis of lysosome-related organelles complex 1 subunit 2 n=1 Tax=Panagrellus redivivus TaxID=6233 RepID=A0A7E4VQE1_PANRE